MAERPYFKVVEDEEFLAEARQEFGDARIWDDVRLVIETDIVRDPGSFPYFPGTNFHFAPLNVVPPRIIIFQIDFDEEIVYYRGLRKTGYG